MIHNTAIIDPKAKISSGVSIGAFTVIGPNVEIGENTIIQSHVSIICLLYTSPSPRDLSTSRMPSSA